MEEARKGNPSWRGGGRPWEETGNGLGSLTVIRVGSRTCIQYGCPQLATLLYVYAATYSRDGVGERAGVRLVVSFLCHSAALDNALATCESTSVVVERKIEIWWWLERTLMFRLGTTITTRSAHIYIMLRCMQASRNSAVQLTMKEVDWM